MDLAARATSRKRRATRGGNGVQVPFGPSLEELCDGFMSGRSGPSTRGIDMADQDEPRKRRGQRGCYYAASPTTCQARSAHARARLRLYNAGAVGVAGERGTGVTTQSGTEVILRAGPWEA